MKKFVATLTALLFGLPLAVVAQLPSTVNTAFSGVSLLTGAPATVTQTNGAVKLPTFSGTGVLTITGTGIAGSPSGCTFTLAYRGNNSPTTGSVVSTTSFTPASGVQTFNISPSVTSGDGYVPVYACTTYPTAGSITASFSPILTATSDPCINSIKSSVSVAITTATTTTLVPLSASKAVYMCGFSATVGATTTLAFASGTGTNCGTGTATLTGAMAPATGTLVTLSSPTGTVITAPASQALCLVSTGTGGIQGVLTYTQQ